MRLYNENEMERLELNGRTGGKMKVFCPLCRDRRKNKRDKSVSVDMDKGVAKCHYCGEVFHDKKRKNTDNTDDANKHRLREYTTEKNKKNPCKSVWSASSVFPSPSEGNAGSGTLPQHTEWFLRERGVSRETLERMGIGSKEEWMPQTQKQEWCICFNYYEEGQLVNTKYRDLAKNFKMIAGAEVIPYNIDGIKGTPECIIVEGEIDALSFAEIGRTDVISVPAGANKNLTWLDRFMETHLEDKKVIYIAVDTDRKGKELCEELVKKLGAGRCKVVTFLLPPPPPTGTPPQAGGEAARRCTQDHHAGGNVPQRSLHAASNPSANKELCETLCNSVVKMTDGDACKDANEVLVKHGSEALHRCLIEAEEVPLEGVYTLKDATTGLRELFTKGMQRGAETGWANFDEYCTVETGRLMVVTGIPNTGKSEFVDELVMRLNIKHGWKVAYFSPENMPLEYHLRKLVEKYTGKRFKEGCLTEKEYVKAERYLTENYSFIMPKDDFSVESILEKAKALVDRFGLNALVLDPFNRFEHQIPTGQTETQYISALLDKFTNFALRNDCLVIVVAHPRKMYKDPGSLKEPVPTLYDINGSAAFYNKCDFGLVVERDYEAGATRIHIEKVRFKHLGGKGKAVFMYNTINGRYAPCEIDTQTGKAWKAEFDNEGWDTPKTI